MTEFKYLLPTTLSSENHQDFQNEILNVIGEKPIDRLVLDASNTHYISSAGLRVVLTLKGKFNNVEVINASPEVFDIFNMTGFTTIINVGRALRQVSIEGCRCIGKGAHGTVYSLAPDTIVKVYRDTTFEEIRQEREVSKKAFVLGLPTAIALDIVRVGDQFGTVFELLNSQSCVDYVNHSQAQMDDYIDKAVALLKQIHKVPLTDGSLPDMKRRTYDYLDKVRCYVNEETYSALKEFVDAIPESKTLLHGDYHLKNQLMVKNGDLMLIDMDTLCVGNPIFEMAQIYNAYYEYGAVEPSIAENFLDLPLDKINYLWNQISRKYYSNLNDEQYQKEVNKIRLLGCIRAVNFFGKHGFKKELLDKCLAHLHDALKNLK